MEVFNLNQASATLAALPRRRTFVSLDVRYQAAGSLSRIFTGDLRKAVVSRSGVDFVVKLTAGMGARPSHRAGVARLRGQHVPSPRWCIAEAMGVGLGNAVEALRGRRSRPGRRVRRRHRAARWRRRLDASVATQG